MFKVKRSRSVIHSLSHHAVSALSWLRPRLGKECSNQSVTEISFDLLNRNVLNKKIVVSNETKTAFDTLSITFERIALAEGVLLSQLTEASLSFGFSKNNWPYYCICTCTSLSGKTLEIKVDMFGNKFGLLSKVRGIFI